MSTTATVEQFVLFDLGINISDLRDAKEKLMIVSKAPLTLKAYQHSWTTFEHWCADAHRSALPASVETVSLYVSWALEVRGYRLETVKLALTAIKARHRELALPLPVDDTVRLLIRCATRKRCEEPRGKAALTPAQLRKICRTLSDDKPLVKRDRALLLLGFACGSRRSELALLRFADIRFVERGMTIYIRRSKTDQEGKGRVVGIPMGEQELTCPVRAMKIWTEARGDWAGPLFPRFSAQGRMERASLRGEAINVAIKKLLAKIEVDTAPYGAHSLRAGMATAAAENGADTIAIKDRGGWKSLHMVLKYVRPAQAFRHDPLAGVL